MTVIEVQRICTGCYNAGFVIPVLSEVEGMWKFHNYNGGCEKEERTPEGVLSNSNQSVHPSQEPQTREGVGK